MINFRQYPAMTSVTIPNNIRLSSGNFSRAFDNMYNLVNSNFNHNNIIGFIREGDDEHPDSGLAVVMTDKEGGPIQMNVGRRLANTVLYDCTGNLQETVYVDNEGNGIFYCKDGSVSVWIKQGKYVN